MRSKFKNKARKECLCWTLLLLSKKKGKKKSSVNPSPRAVSSQWVRTARCWLSGWLVRAPTALGSGNHIAPVPEGQRLAQKVREREPAGTGAGTEGLLRLVLVVSPGGLCWLAGAVQCTSASTAPKADLASLHGKGTMQWEVGKCHCSGVKGNIRSAPLRDTIPSGHQK